MSKLKAYNVVATADVNPEVVDSLGCTEWAAYDKSEVDKVIAELEGKLQAANEQIENLINSASRIMLFQDRVKDDKCAELRHANYKRCLAMAEMCHERSRWYQKMWESVRKDGYDREGSFYRHCIQWFHRGCKLRELAKKFKEAK